MIMNPGFAFEENSCWLLANIRDQWEIFLLSSAKPDAENSTVLADSKFISILRQRKEEAQFIEICLVTQKAVSEKNF